MKNELQYLEFTYWFDKHNNDLCIKFYKRHILIGDPTVVTLPKANALINAYNDKFANINLSELDFLYFAKEELKKQLIKECLSEK